MKNLKEADLEDAAAVLAIANTPLFLLRKLTVDPVVVELARTNTPDELIGAIADIAKSAPSTATDYVRPYVYLVALSKTGDVRDLERVKSYGSEAKWEWFEYLRRVLRDVSVPTHRSLTVEPTSFKSFSMRNHSGASAVATSLTMEPVGGNA